MRIHAAIIMASILCSGCSAERSADAIDTMASQSKWASEATRCEVSFETRRPSVSQSGPMAAVIYLKNLGAERVGQEADTSIIESFLAVGKLVVVVDYANHPSARVPYLNRDIYKLRSDIHAKRFLSEYNIDMAHVFIVPEGCRIMRDVEFCRNGQRVLGMDIIYPSKPSRPIGAVLEFSCDNKDRMGMYSLVFCSDTILEAGASAGFAAAMADHPVAPPYKGLDPMPDCGYKVKAAIRVLRELGPKLGTNGRIGVAGFSRGSGMALLLAATNGRDDFAGRGASPDVSSDVQAAVVMSGRFTYLDLLPTDAMIPRYEQAWGTCKEHEDVWRRHGAMDYMDKNTAPLFLTINRTEAPEALHQMRVLRKRLDDLGVKYTYAPEKEGRGHKMPLDEKVLGKMYAFLSEHLDKNRSAK